MNWVIDFQRKQAFNKQYARSNYSFAQFSFSDDEPITIAPPNSVQLVIKNNKEAPFKENSQKLMLELTGSDSTIDRPGLDLVAILDMSGSMSGEKMSELKIAMQFVLRKLCPIDRLSIVSFSDGAARLCPLRQIRIAEDNGWSYVSRWHQHKGRPSDRTEGPCRPQGE